MKKIFSCFMPAAVLAAMAAVSSCDPKTVDEEPLTAPTISIGEVTFVGSGSSASVTITTSGNAENVFWAYAEASAAEPETYTPEPVGEDGTVDISTPELPAGSYVIYAYAENEAGKSETVKTEAFEIASITVSFGPVTIDAEKQTATTVITPSANAESVSWAFADRYAETAPEASEFTKAEIAEDGTVTISVKMKPGNWRFYAFAENSADKSATVMSDPFIIEVIESDKELIKNFYGNEPILNLTAYSMDINVEMTEDCVRYCVSAFSGTKGADGKNILSYDEERFIESARNSINPNQDYPYMPFNVFTESKVVPERLLSKGTLQSDPTSTGFVLNRNSAESGTSGASLIPYIVAVYAEDADQNYKVYTTDVFTLPTPTFGDTPEVKITANEKTMTSINASYEAVGDCAKIIRGYCLPSEAKADSGFDSWDDPAAVEEFLSSLAVTYTPFEWKNVPLYEDVPKALEPNTDVYVYAIGVTADGKLGKLCYEKLTSASPELDGKGGVNVEFVNEEPLGTLNFKVTLTDGATSARVMVVDKNNYSMVSGDLEWVFTDEAQDYRWTEVTVADLEASKGIVSFPALYPSTTYYVHAVAITDDGAVSPVKDFATVKSEAEPEPEKIDYSLGKGKATIENAKEQTYYVPSDGWAPESWEVDLTYNISKGENTDKVYKVLIREMTLDINDEEQGMADVKAYIEEKYPTEEDYEYLSPVEDFTQVFTQQYCPTYDSYYGGTVIALVTVDADGNYSVADYHVVIGDTDSTTERPVE